MGEPAAADVLVTERLRLRRLVPADLAALQRLYGDPEVMRYVTGAPRTAQQTRARLAAHLAQYARHGFGLYATLLRPTGEVIGRCGLEPREDADGLYGDLAWLFAREHWGRGLGTEVGRALVAYGLGPLGLRRVVATAHPEHAASIRIMQKLGMRHLSTTPRQVVYVLSAPR